MGCSVNLGTVKFEMFWDMQLEVQAGLKDSELASEEISD